MSDLQDTSTPEVVDAQSANMVPGEVETAQTIDPQSQGASKSQFGKLLLALALFAFAGGWGYANQEDLKQSLGYAPESCSAAGIPDCSACCSKAHAADSEGGGACCAHTGGTCPMAAGTEMAAKSETCCQKSQQAALAAALLDGAEGTTNEEFIEVEESTEKAVALIVETEVEAAVEETEAGSEVVETETETPETETEEVSAE